MSAYTTRQQNVTPLSVYSDDLVQYIYDNLTMLTGNQNATGGNITYVLETDCALLRLGRTIAYEFLK